MPAGSHELGRQAAAVPGRATVHRVMARNGLVKPQEQQHGRKYKRWQRDAPMQLWQLDIVGGVPLADGREAKIVTGIDDCSRFVVVSAVITVQSGRAVTEAFAAAMRRYGVPFEVLTDIQAFHRPAYPAAAGGGAVRAGLPGERHPAAAYEAEVANHDGKDRAVPQDAAGRAG